ncbi:MAG: matrixin family metalloprotease [Anaerolineae bacterium]|nr:matrixin family metalloprotease [Anaerolineae bacterium]
MPTDAQVQATLTHLQNSKKRIEVDGTRYYLVEGDLLLDEGELFLYALEQATLEEARQEGIHVERQPLVGIVDDEERIIRWERGLDLTYTVRRETFPSAAMYEIVVDAMLIATADWEDTCAVTFRHLVEADNGAAVDPPPLFEVMHFDTRGEIVASAFFPSHPQERRRVLIDPSFFEPDLGFSREGVLRHELGHVLGFRHEHIRSMAPALCPDETLGNTIDLTDYDPQSVMHYFCGGVGSPELLITEVDRQGARQVYGPPEHLIRYVR